MRFQILDVRFWIRVVACLAGPFILFLSPHAVGQVENVPIGNQVYDFLDRMGVKGILPLYSNTAIPLSRKEVADFILRVQEERERLTAADREFLRKFEQEFAHEIHPQVETASILFRDGLDLFSDKEKYLYAYSDSSLTTYIEFLGSFDYRRSSGDSYGSVHATLENHGGRIRGTIKQRLGYFLQATNGTLFGDRAFALSDPRLRSNVKFNDLDSPYFDFTEAYLRADLSWFNLQFGREYSRFGTGYSDRLLLSDNAPVFDFLKLDAHYKSLRFSFIHGSLLPDSTVFAGIPVTEPIGSNKYLAMHRIQLSLFDMLNVSASEMIIYQRYSPEFAYLNPINFYKSSEHSLRDRDNALLDFDVELFPVAGYKVYGSWLIDDIDFSKMGTGWWGNEFGWQGGACITDAAGLANVDAVIEYTRLEPYLYTNRLNGNDYTHNNTGLGHHLPPNSDEWFLQFRYRPMKSLRTLITYIHERHGENIISTGQVIKNVGGDVMQGHRNTDSETAAFLDGNLVRKDHVRLQAIYEPATNFFVTGSYEFQQTYNSSFAQTTNDHLASIKVSVEY
ncbi:MAG: hypothetical protein HY033_07275 [Ignavibacteriae bacterium]|nr:hypothetical protein [Ignavibacteria bacterium]MBI3364693.1 hypothetical protein [Ignavibacteriota bacterium]